MSELSPQELARYEAVEHVRRKRYLGNFPGLIVTAIIINSIATPILIHGLANPTVRGVFRTSTSMSGTAWLGILLGIAGHIVFIMGIHSLLVGLHGHFAISRITLDQRLRISMDDV